MLASSALLPLLLAAALAAAVAGQDMFHFDDEDYDDEFYEEEHSSSAATTAFTDAETPPPTATDVSATSTAAPTTITAEAADDVENVTDATTTTTTTTTTMTTPTTTISTTTTPITTTTTTPATTTTTTPTTTTTTPTTMTTTMSTTTSSTTTIAPTTEGEDERELHSLRGGGDDEDGHEGTKRAGSTQAKGAATITKAMQAKSAATKGRDRSNSKNAQKQTSEPDDVTNSIYNPTTPIDPDEEDLHFIKVLTPFEMITRGPYHAPPTESGPAKGSPYKLTPELAQKLQKLDFYFMQLAILAEDCRRRLLCEVADQQLDFQPLSFVLTEESSFRGNYESVRPALMSTTEGARLLTYMEATASGRDRARGCSGFVYRCPTKAQDMVDMEALALWRDMVRWMSVQVVARRPAAPT